MSQKTRGKQSAYWDFVLNNYTDDMCVAVSDEILNCDQYFESIVGKEVGASGTPHLQGYIKLNKRQYKSFLLNSNLNKGILKDKLSFRPGRNPEALKAYVQKEGNLLLYKVNDKPKEIKPIKKAIPPDVEARHITHSKYLNLHELHLLFKYGHKYPLLDEYRTIYNCPLCKLIKTSPYI